MLEQVKKLEAILKRRAINLDKDNGDDNSASKFWEFIKPDELELWSIKLDPMTTLTHFVQKFKNMPAFFLISHDELVKKSAI
jgi:hypothetical protein